MKRIASCSFGKDSLAAIIVSEKSGEHIDAAVYCRIMFDDETSAELPEHDEFIHTKAIPLLKSRYGIETTVVQAQKTYCNMFFTKYQRGGRIGKIYGFPMLKGPWCNDRLKIEPIKAWQKETGDHTAVVGIAADEQMRAARNTVAGKYLPLVENGITETMAFEICKREGLLSPAYNGGRKRLGCWFCHNQRISELRRLRKEHSTLWEKLLSLDAASPRTFKPGGRTLTYFDRRFGEEDMQLSLADFATR